MSSSSDHELIKSLYALAEKNKKLVHPNQQKSPTHPDVTLTSWKMNEFKYYDIPSPFPTLARGLFTQKNENGEYRIVVRGYDKFFNIGEVPWNTWEELERNTTSPYTLTLKSNGCIIFMAALTPDKVVVTSKHSLNSDHARVGEVWLRKCVESKGKTVEDFAAALWKNNWTAVAELCDDSFEEHVLPYSKENTGLHLHGLNENRKEFSTMLPDVVDEFAREWGFIVTKSTVLQTIPEVRKFTEAINESQEWNGEALEGFVVRTHVGVPPTKGNVRRNASPYAPGSSFFFKVKFDEPYMMYRDWRELTKQCLTMADKGAINIGALSKKRMQRPETKVYVNWVVAEIKRDKRQFDGYQDNHGIVATRERFLKWLADSKGQTGAAADGSDVQPAAPAEKTFGKTIIVPIAVPGCGKTTVAIGLKHIFGFGHTQSDDVRAKKPAPIFLRNVVDLLKTHDVVIADKNNHLRQHREGLRNAVKHMHPTVRLLALNWSIDQPPAIVHNLLSDRILGRGANHQTLHADTSAARAHEEVLWMFLKQVEDLSPSEVDVVVDMDLTRTPEEMLRHAVDACVRELGLPQPSEEKIQEALVVTQRYQASSTQAPETKTKDRSKGPRYYGLLPEVDLTTTLDGLIADAADGPKDFWARLKKEKRVAKQPHVTLVHQKGLPADQALWDACSTVVQAKSTPLFSMRLSTLLWNERVMALVVDDLAISSDKPDTEGTGVNFTLQLPQELRQRLHVTVGTWSESIPPFEARALVEAWRHGKTEKIGILPLKDVFTIGRVKGLFS